MSNKFKVTLIGLAIVVGITATFVYVAARQHLQRQSAGMALIRDMGRIDQQLSQASFEFGLALTEYLKQAEAADSGGDSTAVNSTAVNSSAVQQAHRTLVEVVNQSIAVVSRVDPPASEHGVAFIAAQRKFLLIQRGIIREQFGKLLQLLENDTIPPAERRISIQRIVNAAFAETETEFALVHAARAKFATELAIHLTTE